MNIDAVTSVSWMTVVLVISLAIGLLLYAMFEFTLNGIFRMIGAFLFGPEFYPSDYLMIRGWVRQNTPAGDGFFHPDFGAVTYSLDVALILEGNRKQSYWDN